MSALYHGYQQVRNRKVTGALIQGVETARAVLTATPQGQAADAQLVRWLMEHQKEAAVFATISALVDRVSANPAAKMTAEGMAERLKSAGAKPVGSIGWLEGTDWVALTEAPKQTLTMRIRVGRSARATLFIEQFL